MRRSPPAFLGLALAASWLLLSALPAAAEEPGKPADFAVQQRTRTAVDLSWRRDASATSWQYRHKTTGQFGAWTTLDVVTRSQTQSARVSGLTALATYTFELRGVNADGAGDESDAMTVRLVEVDVPPRVANLRAVPGVDPDNARILTVTLTWDDIPGVLGWRSEGARSPGFETPLGHEYHTGAATRQMSALRSNIDGRVHYFRVRAVNSAGNGPWSETVTAVPVSARPAKPGGLTATAGNAQVRLRWNALVTASGWEYQYQTGGGAYSNWVLGRS